MVTSNGELFKVSNSVWKTSCLNPILRHLNANICNKGVVFIFSISLQLRWPIEPHFPQICCFMHKICWDTPSGIWQFQNAFSALPSLKTLWNTAVMNLGLVLFSLLKINKIKLKCYRVVLNTFPLDLWSSIDRSTQQKKLLAFPLSSENLLSFSIKCQLTLNASRWVGMSYD